MSLSNQFRQKNLSRPIPIWNEAARAFSQQLGFHPSNQQTQLDDLKPYWDKPYQYITEQLHWIPWSGASCNSIGQVEIIEYYRQILVALTERQQYENGQIEPGDLQYYVPGQSVKSWISIDAGYNIGKTKLAAGLVSHFFDTFSPCIIYCFAPQWIQINDLLFKEIRLQRNPTNLPGEVLARQPRITHQEGHFVTGRATKEYVKSESIQGQHSEHLMFVVDEAEGVAGIVFEAIASMASGGFAVVLIVRNPRTTVCRAHQLRSQPHVLPLTISCLNSPNVIEDRDVIPGMVRRDYIESMLEYAEVVSHHNLEEYTFELPWQPDTIYKPGPEFLWRVLGIASEALSYDTFCSLGRYDAAKERGKQPFYPTEQWARFGVDAARFGGDLGTVYIRRGDWLWRSAAYQQSDSMTFYNHILEQMEQLVADGVVDIEVRVDAGGGWGAGLIDLLKYNLDLQNRQTVQEMVEVETDLQKIDQLKKENKWWKLRDFSVFEVNFNGTTTEPRKFYDLITEIYYYLGQALEVLHLQYPPQLLRVDICERSYKYGMKSGRSVKQLLSKDQFRVEYKHSPDDGDGAGLANAPSHLFRKKPLLLFAG